MDTSSGDEGSSMNQGDDKSIHNTEEAGRINVNSHFEEFLMQHQLQQQSSPGNALDLGQQQLLNNSQEGSDELMGNVEVDESPLKPSLNRNKESLKLKLQMRRPFNQLVEQGILPSPNTPPAFACQRVKLERARMSDLLKAKIQQRPSRQELVRQHILEETDSRVAPLLAEKQRMLKRARLADSLNDHLIHRPGPLELVQKNILHAPDESIEKAIKEGIVPFKATCEGAIPGPSLPTKYICQEDDSSSDVSSPSVNLDSTPIEESSDSLPPVTTASNLNEVESSKSPSEHQPLSEVSEPPKPDTVLPQFSFSSVPIPPPFPFTANNAGLSEVKVTLQSSQSPQQNVGIFAVPIFTSPSQPPPPVPTAITQSQQPLYQHSQSSIKSRSKKICKPKSQPKPKTIKFHEYKGPPIAQKSSGGLGSLDLGQKRPGESSYELLLQQQQLFLQWQLEWQHRFPKILLPAGSKMSLSADDKKSFCSSITSLPIVTSTVSPITATTVFPSTVSHHQNIQPCLAAPPGSNETLPVQIISTGSLTPAFCRENSVLILSSAPSPSTNESLPKPIGNTQQIAPALSANFQNQIAQNSSGPQQTTFIITNTTGTPPPVPIKIANNAEKDTQIKQETSQVTSTNNNNNNKSSVPLKLNDWKVNELKAELKKRNLPVSGSKSQLLERLQSSYLKNPESKPTTGNGPDKESSAPKQTKSVEEVSEGKSKAGESIQQNVQPTTAQELKFYVTNTGNGATTISLPNALEFLQKSGVLSTEKDSQGGPTQVLIQPSSRSVLQQKIQQKLLQQAIKTQNQLKESNQNSTSNQVKTALAAPLVTSVGIINQQELRTWIPSSTVIDADNNSVPEKEISQTTDPVDVKPEISSSNNLPSSENAWVLKITESSDTGQTEFQKSFENCLADLLSDSTEEPNGQSGGIEVDLGADADHIKSQMVDDVLEILIRNGELPASAAQHLPGGSQDKQAHLVATESEKEPGFIPPAPPLPPSTFAITLPTEISFRRTHGINAPLSFDSNPLEGQSVVPGERKGSLGMTMLTKDAQEILKISEELATFGKSHNADIASTESQSKHAHLVPQSVGQFASAGIKTERKECDGRPQNGSDSMDLCMDDSHSISLHSDVGLLEHGTPFIIHHGHLPTGHILRPQSESMDISTGGGGRDHFPGIVKPGNNGEQSITELLTEDLEFPMDTEYSDWLESFSSDNAFANNFNKTSGDESNKPGNKVVHVRVAEGGDPFGSSMLSNDPFSHRDPLLSSKSSTRITAANNHNNILDNCSSNSNVLMDIDTETDLGRRKDGHHHPPSAIDVNVNDLWDFSF